MAIEVISTPTNQANGNQNLELLGAQGFEIINSLGNITLDLTCVCFIDLDVLTKDDNSPYLLESTSFIFPLYFI